MAIEMFPIGFLPMTCGYRSLSKLSGILPSKKALSNKLLYSYEYNSLFDSDFFNGSMPDSLNSERYPHVIGRKPIGNISIANSDSGGSAYVDAAIVQADRAVNELL